MDIMLLNHLMHSYFKIVSLSQVIYFYFHFDRNMFSFLIRLDSSYFALLVISNLVVTGFRLVRVVFKKAE